MLGQGGSCHRDEALLRRWREKMDMLQHQKQVCLMLSGSAPRVMILAAMGFDAEGYPWVRSRIPIRFHEAMNHRSSPCLESGMRAQLLTHAFFLWVRSRDLARNLVK